MADIRVLETSGSVNQYAVEKLEKYLELAKKGEVTSVALAVTYNDGSTGQSWSPTSNLFGLLGSLTLLTVELSHDKLKDEGRA